MGRSVGEWWDARSEGEKTLLKIGAGVVGVSLGCAVLTHGLVVVTPKAVIAVGPAAKVLAKALVAATA
jgi:hypothetical protein